MRRQCEVCERVFISKHGNQRLCGHADCRAALNARNNMNHWRREYRRRLKAVAERHSDAEMDAIPDKTDS